MSKRYIIVMLVFLFSAFSSNISYAALNDFKQDYQKEENSKSGSSGSGSSNSGSGSSGSGNNDLADCIGGCIWDGCLSFGSLWFLINHSLEYSKYPYYQDEKNNFICNYSIDQTGKDSPSQVQEIAYKEIPDSPKIKGCFDGKDWFLTLEGGWQNAFDNGTGGFGRISGKIFRLIGPEIEAKRIVDKNDEHLDYYAIGVNIPIVQFSGFMPDFYIQAAFLRGIIDRNGVSYGIIINSYPVRPLSFMLRFGRQSYGNIKGEEYGKIKFYDYEGRVGIIFNRFEIFAGYRKTAALYAELKGPVAGVKIFF